jgi:Ras-related protein Rab-6A
MFIETSAKAGYNIKALFRKLASVLPGMNDGATQISGESTGMLPLLLLRTPFTAPHARAYVYASRLLFSFMQL